MSVNYKLSHRIMWGYSIPIILSIIAASTVYVKLRESTEKSQQVEAAHINVEESKDLAYSIAGMQRSLRGYLLNKNNTIEANYQKAEKQFEQLVTTLPEKVKDVQQKERLKKIQELGRIIANLANKVMPLVDQGKVDQAIDIWRAARTGEVAKELDKVVTDFEATEKKILLEKQQSNNQALELVRLTVFLSTAISGVLAMIIAYLLTSKLKQTLNDTVSVIASSSRELAATVEQQERTTVQQSSSVNQTTTTMNELGSSSQRSAQQAEAAAESARRVLSISHSGNQTVDETLAGMAQLKDKVSAIAQQIIRLSEQTSQIGSISNVVTDLANQTNMLALNASVEAVRAGEHGKGFAVVAGEIRRLADQSKKSSEKINNLVVDIQKAINSTVVATDEGTRTVEDGAKLTQKTATAFAEVSDAVNDVVVNNQQILLTAQQQVIAIEQVVEAMNILNQSAKDTAASISQTKVATQQLNSTAQNLQLII